MDEDCCTIAEFRVRFPEYSNVTDYPDARIQLFLDDAAAFIGCSLQVKYQCTAKCYLAAHLLLTSPTTGGGNGNVGPVTQKTVDRMSKTISVVAPEWDEAFFTTSAYGSRFLTYWRRRFKSGLFIAKPTEAPQRGVGLDVV